MGVRMKDIIICNAVPAYEEAPVSLTLLKEHTEEILNTLMKETVNECFLIVPKNQQMKDIPEGIRVMEAPTTSGFAYGNHSALLKVTENEKAIPYCTNGQLLTESSFVTVEEVLGIDKKKVCIGGKARIKGVCELNKRTTPEEILDVCKSQGTFKGMFFGHPMGRFISASNLKEEILLTTDYIEILDDSDCILNTLLRVIERYDKESCGRCVFGHEGTAQLRMILTDITLKKGKASDIELMLALSHEMQQQSLCEIGYTAANVMISAVETFQSELEEHITKKNCMAGVCSKFVTYHILADMCTGCNECVDACEEDAILGKRKFIHVIDQDECTQCGACLKACEEEAIVKAGAVKPRCPKKPIPCKN
jgi:ferredoxin